MNRKILLAIPFALCLFSCASAQQIDPQMAADSTRILTNMRKVELLNQLVPMALQKNEIDQILPVLERIRDKNRKLLEQEHKDLVEFDKQAGDAVDGGMKGKVPDQDFVRTIEAFYKANDIRRQVAVGENLDMLMPVLLKVLDAGQQKIMANSLTVQFFEPDISTTDANNDSVKQRVFAREVFLDPLAYDLLVQMDK